MNQDLALKVLGEIMGWDDDRARREFAWLKLMARLKYDGYRAFQAGMRFIESLVTWLQQFKSHNRETAYAFVRNALVYIGPMEMQRLVEQFYPKTVRARLVRMVAAECKIQPYRVFADAPVEIARLRRQTLFMGLSDGARIDAIRHANAGVLTNEQFVQVTQIDTAKWKDMLKNLRDDLDDDKVRFRLVYLVDDFIGTGTSFLRLDNEKEWKGKLIRFKDSMDGANKELGPDKLFEDEWELCIHHYLATSTAVEAIRSRLQDYIKSIKGWGDVHTTFGLELPHDLPIKPGPRYDDFIRLTQCYYDPAIETKHTDVGGECHLGLGYGGCALPLVLEHNTPNNSIALLWAESDGVGGAPAMRPLFRRRERHFERRMNGKPL